MVLYTLLPTSKNHKHIDIQIDIYDISNHIHNHLDNMRLSSMSM